MVNFVEKPFRKMDSIWNIATAILAGNLMKYLNINLGIDFTVNSNLNKDYLERQLSRV